jgi:hypothetical protein
MVCGDMKTLVAFVFGAITEEDTFFGAKIKLMVVVRMEVRPTGTAKNFKKSVIRNLIKKMF